MTFVKLKLSCTKKTDNQKYESEYSTILDLLGYDARPGASQGFYFKPRGK